MRILWVLAKNLNLGSIGESVVFLLWQFELGSLTRVRDQH